MNEHWNSLCPGCFEDKRRESVCPHCGYDESAKRGPLVLPHRTLLQGQYLVGRVLGKPGGFGITYLAYDTRLETRVAIKEYLPRDLAGRESSVLTVSAHSPEDGELFRYGLEQFLREARTLAKFDHAHVVRVRNVFEENGTAYLVMDYYDGTTLAEYLHRKGKLPEKTALDILMPILDGLREVHDKGFLHRDIKPQNIYLTHQGRPILLDFGSARVAMGERSKSLSVVLSAGYAPFEQYHRRGDQGPWTDVYASAAVLYQMVTGETPPEAPERSDRDELVPPQKLAPQLSAHIVQAIVRGLALNIRERPQTVREFQDQLMQRVGASKRTNPEPNPEPAPLSKPLYAGFWKRAGAAVVDGIVVLIPLMMVFFVAGMVLGDEVDPFIDQFAVALFLVTGWLYSAGMESSSHGATVGKMVAGIRVCDFQGQRLKFWRASGRYFCKFASSLFLMVGFMMAGFTKRKQALHDKIVCCLVVDRSVPVEPLRRDLADEWDKRMSPITELLAYIIAAGVALGAISPLWLPKETEETVAEGSDAAAPESVPSETPALSPLDELRTKAENGDPDAQNALGRKYDEGEDVALDDAEAVKWYRLAADQGHATAQNNLAFMYRNGEGVDKNDTEAANWHYLAAEQGHAGAQNSLGWMYENGLGVEQDYQEAVKWFRKGAEQDNPEAENNLGWMYYKGLGVSRNYKEAVKWYRKGAEQGNTNAQNNLGIMYDNGFGVPENNSEAVTWYRKAAENGNIYGQYDLALMYEYGHGVDKDMQQALRWYRAAAAQGNKEAKEALKRLDKN